MSNRGKPTVAKNDGERCQAATVMTLWKVAHKKEERCPFMARWQVEKKLLCRHHAVCESFAIGMEQGYIKRLVRPPLVAGQRVRVCTP